MISIGLDLSITSTGICIYDSFNNCTYYYIIGSKFTKKALEHPQQIVTLIPYEKQSTDKKAEYHIKEWTKTTNIFNIVDHMETIIKLWKPDVVTIEGVSFGSSGAVLDLCGLNYAVRMMLLRCNVNNIYIVSPTQNKKFATANGSAEKDVMISAWHKSDKTSEQIPGCIKVDDIADAYFLARFGLHLVTKK